MLLKIKSLKYTLFSLIFLISNLAIASGFPVVDVAATLQRIQQMKQLFDQMILIKTQLSHIKNQSEYLKQQLNSLKGFTWANNKDLLGQLNDIMNQASNISYAANDIKNGFEQAYPGYFAPQNYSEQYKNNTNQTQNTLKGALQTMHQNAKHFDPENQRIKELQNQVQNAKGDTQAIQALAQINSELVSQIQLLRQVIIVQSNAQVAYYASQVQKDASSKAELEKIINAGKKHTPSLLTGNDIRIPHF